MAAPLIGDAVAALAGAVAGFVASLLPGLHVNTLAALVRAAPPAPGPLAAAALVAAFGASAAAAGVAGAFLGAPGEASAATALPAHRMLREGRGYEAAVLTAIAALLGLLVAFVLAVPLRYVLGAPLHGFRHVQGATPALLIALVVLMLWSERGRVAYRRVFLVRPFGSTRLRGCVVAEKADALVVETADGRHVRVVDDLSLLDVATGDEVDAQAEPARVRGPLSRWLARGLALLVLVLSGLLGVVAFQLGARSPFGLPGSPLLPLLAGLFGVPGLVEMLRDRDPPRRQHAFAPRWPWRRFAPGLLRGATAGSLIGLLPGLTPAHAATAALATARREDAEETLVVLGATNGAGLAFTLLAWMALARPRSGALLAAQALAPPPRWFHAVPPPEVALAAAALLVGAVVGLGLAVGTARWLVRLADRLPERGLAVGCLGLIVVATGAFTGALGLLELAAAAAIGLLPLAWGVRRVHAMGVILVPVLMRAVAGG